METYCVNCEENTVHNSCSFNRTRQSRLMLVSN